MEKFDQREVCANHVLDYYVKRFKQLHRNVQPGGKYAPHKPILLLSIIKLIEEEEITTRDVECTNELEETFNRYWKKLAPTNFHRDIATPFYHLKSDGFWELVPHSGQEENLNNRRPGKNPIRTINDLNKLVKCARMNDELFRCIQDQTGRERLRRTLMRLISQ
jgi:predicted restriction endonuclease